jgi:hypothetical protein
MRFARKNRLIPVAIRSGYAPQSRTALAKSGPATVSDCNGLPGVFPMQTAMQACAHLHDHSGKNDRQSRQLHALPQTPRPARPHAHAVCNMPRLPKKWNYFPEFTVAAYEKNERMHSMAHRPKKSVHKTFLVERQGLQG